MPKKRKKPKRRAPSTKRAANARKKKTRLVRRHYVVDRKGRKFATSHHRYMSEVAAKKRRADKKKYGSFEAARKARRQAEEQDRKESAREREAWATAFREMSGRSPTAGDSFYNDVLDHDYRWHGAYAAWKQRGKHRRAPPPSASTRPAPASSVLERVRKLWRTAESGVASPDAATRTEARSALSIAREMMQRHGIHESDL